MASVTVRGVTRRYGTNAAVDGVSLAFGQGEFVSLLGPSGCGKTTLLRTIAGFEPVDAGTIDFDRERMSGEGTHVPPERRQVGMVFQAYALWPHMSVADNVGYPLRVRGVPRAQRTARIEAALRQVSMLAYAERRPADLSGGQRQRVALARCLLLAPRVVLLDEPLANLDVHLREAMQAEFRAFHAHSGATMIYVTHDQAEAMALSDRIAVMSDGRIEQVANPATLFDEPATEMVANFIGRGVVVDGQAETVGPDGTCTARLFGQRIHSRSPNEPAGTARFCLRAEWTSLADGGADTIEARVTQTVYRGGTTTVHAAPVAADTAEPLRLDVPGAAPDLGDRVHLKIDDAWRLPVSR